MTDKVRRYTYSAKWAASSEPRTLKNAKTGKFSRVGDFQRINDLVEAVKDPTTKKGPGQREVLSAIFQGIMNSSDVPALVRIYKAEIQRRSAAKAAENKAKEAAERTKKLALAKERVRKLEEEIKNSS